MGHKKDLKESVNKIEKRDLRSYENELENLKESVKQLKKIQKRKEEIAKLEIKRKKMLKELKNRHK